MWNAVLTKSFVVNGFEFMCLHLRWGEGVKCNLSGNAKNLVNFNISLFNHQDDTEMGLNF